MIESLKKFRSSGVLLSSSHIKVNKINSVGTM